VKKNINRNHHSILDFVLMSYRSYKKTSTGGKSLVTKAYSKLSLINSFILII